MAFCSYIFLEMLGAMGICGGIAESSGMQRGGLRGKRHKSTGFHVGLSGVGL